VAGADGLNGAPGVAGVDGTDGLNGAPGVDGLNGAPGVAGFDGTDGTNGLACWDWNGNGACDELTEDMNADTHCDVLDCIGVDGINGTNGLNGAPGIAGADGLTGAPGVDGADGTNGLACWDWNGNGACDELTEDMNADTFCDVLDCIGLDGINGMDGNNGTNGINGAPGADGVDGTNGADGADGLACWDHNADGIPDAAEDINGDGQWNTLDCSGLLAFAYFYAVMPPDNAATIAIGAAVEFPRNGAANGMITRINAREFTLPAVGVYEVFWQVSINEPGQLAVWLNGTLQAFTVAGRATGTTQIVNQVLITTTVVDSILTIRNSGSASALTVTPLAGGANPVSATLVIKQIL
jgi:hypothetical protein